MATRCEAKYRKSSHTEMLRALRRAKNTLNLRDWDIRLYYGKTIPGWVIRSPYETDKDPLLGEVLPYPDQFAARIWVSSCRCAQCNTHPITTLFHEMIHLFLHLYHTPDKAFSEREDREVRTLEYHLWNSWRYMNGKSTRE